MAQSKVCWLGHGAVSVNHVEFILVMLYVYQGLRNPRLRVRSGLLISMTSKLVWHRSCELVRELVIMTFVSCGEWGWDDGNSKFTTFARSRVSEGKREWSWPITTSHPSP